MSARQARVNLLALLAPLLLGLANAPACRAGEEPGKSGPARTPGAQLRDGQPPVKKEDFRYDGKDFTSWRAYLRAELKPERRAEALAAIRAFTANGYGKEAAHAILDMVRTYKGALSEKDRDVLGKAVMAFRDIGDANAPLLVEGLGDANKHVRSFAAFVLGCHVKSVPAAAVPGLIRATVEGEDDDKWLAVPALAKVDGIDKLLKRELQDEKKAKRFARALTAILEQEAVAGLALLLAADEEKKEVVQAVYSAPAMAACLLGELGPAAGEAVPCLLTALKKEVSLNLLPVAAAEALGRIGADPEQVVPGLVAALKKDNAALRACAAGALGRFGPRARAAAPALRAALADKDPAVCLRAFVALHLLGEDSRKLVPGVLDVLKKTDRGARQKVYESLQEQGDLPLTAFVPLLLGAFDELPDDRAAIAATLGHFGPLAREAVGRLTRALEDNHPEVRRAAALALKRIREGDALPD
jgi:HEAT repeat protein